MLLDNLTVCATRRSPPSSTSSPPGYPPRAAARPTACTPPSPRPHTPRGGGATAALHAAQSAALLAMVARYSDAAKYDADLMSHVITEADGIRNDALTLAERDASAAGA